MKVYVDVDAGIIVLDLKLSGFSCQESFELFINLQELSTYHK